MQYSITLTQTHTFKLWQQSIPIKTEKRVELTFFFKDFYRFLDLIQNNKSQNLS